MINSNSTGGLSGVVYSGQTQIGPPQVVVVGPEKSGKSCTTTTLFDWPVPGARPFVLAADSAGVEACASLGYNVAHRKIKDAPGQLFVEKMNAVITDLHAKWKPLGVDDFPFSTVVIDCASTLGEIFLQEDLEHNPSADSRRNYGTLLRQLSQVFWRLKSLDCPIIWLGWERPASEFSSGSGENKKTKREDGGIEIPGKFRQSLAGWAQQILILRKRRVGKIPGADQDGFIREFHTRDYEGTRAGGRRQAYLPDPCPVNLGWILNVLMGLNPPQQ